MAAAMPWFSPSESRLAGPAGLPPAGHTSDIHAANPFIRPIAIQVAVALFGAVVLTAMRLFTQHFVSEGLVVEDYVLLAGMVVQVACIILDVFIVQSGLGKHMWNLSMEQFFRVSRLVLIFVTFYHISVALVKVAILLQIKRIFGTNRTIRGICWICMAVDVMVYVPCTFMSVFQCSPISGAWDRAQKSRCIDVGRLYEATGIFSVVSDFVTLVIPVIIIMRLNMSVKRKWLVMAVFATGIVAWVASILRAVWTFRAFHSPSGDLSYNLIWVGIFCSYEVVFGILTFFMPIAAVLVRYLRTRLLARTKVGPPSPMWKQYAAHVEGTLPKRANHPYEMPSLASFEERALGIERQITTTIEFMPAVREVDNGSSNKSNLSNSLERVLW